MTITRRSFLRTGVGAAAVGYAGRLQAADKPATAGIAATPDHFRQQIDGFGFSEAFHQGRAIRMLSETDQADILKLLFSPNGGMGYSMLRNEIGNGPENAGKKDGTVASIEPQPDQFNWTGDEDRYG